MEFWKEQCGCFMKRGVEGWEWRPEEWVEALAMVQMTDGENLD